MYISVYILHTYLHYTRVDHVRQSLPGGLSQFLCMGALGPSINFARLGSRAPLSVAEDQWQQSGITTLKLFYLGERSKNLGHWLTEPLILGLHRIFVPAGWADYGSGRAEHEI